MSKSLVEQGLDQLAHALGAAALLTPIALFGYNPLTTAVTATLAGILREYTEEEAKPIFSWSHAFSPRSLLDISGWTLGGFIFGLLTT